MNDKELEKSYKGIEEDLETLEYEGYYNHLEQLNFIKNYITNLQQENARLKDKNQKAINLINEYMEKWKFFEEVYTSLNNISNSLKGEEEN